MTETCGIITSIGADYFVDKPASCGPAMPAYETKVVNPETGEERAIGEAGELWVRGGRGFAAASTGQMPQQKPSSTVGYALGIWLGKTRMALVHRRSNQRHGVAWR